jgi:hypothetical protein
VAGIINLTQGAGARDRDDRQQVLPSPLWSDRPDAALHIITLEDPIEYEFKRIAMISQRAIGRRAPQATCVTACPGPDVILWAR